MENKKPKHLLILKILGFVFVTIGIIGIVLSVKGFGDFSNNNFMIGGMMTCFGFFAGFTCLTFGFLPQMSRMSVKTTKYIQQENKEDLTEIANTNADIQSDAITMKTKALKKGLKDTMFCKHCGAEIDADSKFCNRCGKEQ